MNGNMESMLCLSIRQPWAYMILNCGKDVENRTWSTKVRGRVLIHASKGMTADEWSDAWWFALGIESDTGIKGSGMTVTNYQDVKRGGIVGSVEIVDCVTRSDSPWFGGPYGFVLRDPQPLPFMPCRGALGFFRYNAGIEFPERSGGKLQ